MDFIIRKMKVSDISEICALGAGHKEFSTESASFWSEKQIKRWCKSSKDILLVAEMGDKIVGFSFYAGHVPTGKVTWENLYVDPSARGLGVARQLIQEGLKQIKRLGYGYIMLCVNAENQDSFASIVEKYGFKKGNRVLWMDKML